MRHEVLISDIRFTPASAALRATGLRGWAMCRIDGRWELDGLTVRRSPGGGHELRFPSKTDGKGIDRPYVRPITQEVREAVESQVLQVLRERGFLP